MNFSLRKFLLINFLLAILLMSSLTAMGIYFLNLKVIQEHIDEVLIETGLSFRAILNEPLSHSAIKKIQATINQMPEETMQILKMKLSRTSPHSLYKDRIQMQVWNNKNELILFTQDSPKTSLSPSSEEGLSQININGVEWRVFSTIDHQSGTKVIIAAEENIRDDLARDIAKNYLLTLIIIFPIASLVIWHIIGMAFNSLNAAAQEVGNRNPHDLRPVKIEHVPIEIKPVIDEINQLFRRMQQVFEREQRFAADAAHELRTPLAALKTQMQVALQTKDPHDREVALQNVMCGIDRSSHIVQQLLTLSRLAPGGSHLEEIAIVELPKLAAEVIAQLVPAAVSKQIDIELAANKESIHINAYPIALGILIRNLVDNAIRYTPNFGKIKISINDDESNQSITFKVEDNGPGIPIELHSRVFERFFRVIGNKTMGSGLGLAIVEQIACLHHADVKLSSPQVGSGLIVEVIFPKPLPNSSTSLNKK